MTAVPPEPSNLNEPAVAAEAHRPRMRLWGLNGFPALPLHPIGRLIARLQAWQERARGRSHLQALNDHMLKDLGLSRADVEHEISKWYWRD